jgi:hypothetical protein
MTVTLKFNVAGKQFNENNFENYEKIKDMINEYKEKIQYVTMQTVSYDTVSNLTIDPKAICAKITDIDFISNKCTINNDIDNSEFELTEHFVNLAHITFDVLAGVDETSIERYSVVRIIRARLSILKF